MAQLRAAPQHGDSLREPARRAGQPREPQHDRAPHRVWPQFGDPPGRGRSRRDPVTLERSKQLACQERIPPRGVVAGEHEPLIRTAEAGPHQLANRTDTQRAWRQHRRHRLSGDLIEQLQLPTRLAHPRG